MYSAGKNQRDEQQQQQQMAYGYAQPIHAAYPTQQPISEQQVYEVPGGGGYAGGYGGSYYGHHPQPTPTATAYAHAPPALHVPPAPPKPTTAVYQGGGDNGYYDPEAQATIPSSFVEKAEAQMRLALLRKVYSILSIQLLLTIGMACLFSFNNSVNNFIMSTPQLFPIAIVLSFVCLIALFCFRQKHPWNMVILGVFTLVEAYTLGLVCSIYYRQGAGELVLQAFGITAGIFIGLTAYTLMSKKDFSFLGGFCFAGLIGLMVWGLVSWLTGWRSTFWYSLIGAILFSALIVYDTFLLSRKFGPDDYVIAAIMLYLDVINLFLMVLNLLGGNRRD